MNTYLQDLFGNKSSKRLIGCVLSLSGLILEISLFFITIFIPTIPMEKLKLASYIGDVLIGSGCSLLLGTVFDMLKKE